jgi:predicted aspartyl protease
VWRPPGPLTAGCTLTMRASVPLRDARDFMLAPISLDGQQVTMIVDTGAEATTVTPGASERLGLRPDGGRPRLLRGVAGNISSNNVRVHELALDEHLVHLNRTLGVGALPPFPGVSPPVSGLLGTDVLAGYEVELNLPAQRMVLYTASGCAGYTPWPNAVVVPFRRTRSGQVFVTAMLGGRKVQALLDTGARTTLVKHQTALSLGVSEAALAADPSRSGVGIGMGHIVFFQHRFALVGLPGAIENEMSLDVADLSLPGVEMLLGADYLGARKVWISYNTDRLFLRQ